MEDGLARRRVEWAPWVRNTFGLVGWTLGWATFAAAAGIVWVFSRRGSLETGRVMVQSAVVGLALVFLVPIVFFIDVAGALAQKAWDEYPWPVAKRVIAVVSLLFLVLAVPYLWLAWWLTQKAAVRQRAAAAMVRWDAGELRWNASGKLWLLLFVVNLLLAGLAVVRYRRQPFYSFHRAYAVLGAKKFLGGIVLMASLRLMVPRRDFFLQAPVVGWMWMAAVGILSYCAIPFPVFAISTPLLLLILIFPFISSLYAPPLWIFFGGSQFGSFALFYDLRMQWRRHGLNLLNRVSTGGLEFYDAWRSSLRLAAPSNPNIGRVWSLRTRGPLWQSAVRLVAAFVPVIVVDLRAAASSNVEFEVEWLKRRGFLHKVWVVVSSESDEVADLYRQMGVGLVEKEALLAAEWSGKGLHL